MEYGLRNNIKLDTRIPWRCEYAYIDSQSHRADRLFIRSEIPVRFRRKEMRHADSDYVVVFCRFKSTYEPEFLACMADLEKAMVLEGNSGYRDACVWLEGILSP